MTNQMRSSVFHSFDAHKKPHIAKRGGKWLHWVSRLTDMGQAVRASDFVKKLNDGNSHD